MGMALMATTNIELSFYLVPKVSISSSIQVTTGFNLQIKMYFNCNVLVECIYEHH